MKVKKLIGILISTALTIGLLGGCSASSSPNNESSAPVSDVPDTVYTIRIGCTAALPNQMVWAAYEFETAAEEQSGGRIQVEVYPSSQLGTTTEMIEGMQNGSVDAACFPANWLINYAPLMGYMEVPGLQGVDSVSFTHIGNDTEGMLDFVNEYLNGFNLNLMAYIPTDSTKTMLCNRAITSMADMKGMTVWGFSNDYVTAFCEASGMNVSYFDISDLAVSLQNGTVDGAMAGNCLFAPQQMYEYCSSALVIPEQCGAGAFVMSKLTLDKLPDDLRELVNKISLEVIEETYDYLEELEDDCIQQMVDNGVTFYQVEGDFLTEMRTAFAEARAIYEKIDGSAEWIEKITEASEAWLSENNYTAKVIG